MMKQDLEIVVANFKTFLTTYKSDMRLHEDDINARIRHLDACALRNQIAEELKQHFATL